MMRPGHHLMLLAVLCALGCGEPSLPERLQLDEVVEDVAATEASRLPAGMRADEVAPAPAVQRFGGRRRALVADPLPARLVVRRAIPPGFALAFGVGVQGGATSPDAADAATCFAIEVDGRPVWDRRVSTKDRRWFDERVALGESHGQDAEIALITRTCPGEAPAAGAAGWSQVRLVRRLERERQRASREHPSVLVLLVDTLRADRVGVYGKRGGLTPAFDAWAAQARVFLQAVAQAPWTLPSTATLLSGVHPATHGAGGSTGTPGALPDAIDTLPERAARAGITTVGLSANPLLSRGTNLAQGFETFDEFGFDIRREIWRSAAELDAQLLGWLRRNSGLRFFGWVHYMEPHDPYVPDPEQAPEVPGLRPSVARGTIATLQRRIDAGKAAPLAPAELAHIEGLYDAEVARWDAQFGALLRSLDAAGVLDTTVVVVTADHGEEFLEHGRLRHGGHLYEEQLRVPLAIGGPGVAPGRDGGIAQGIDLLPTLASLLDLDTGGDLPGCDLLSGSCPAERPVISQTGVGYGPDGTPTHEIVSLRRGRWKLVLTPASSRTELYDLDADPNERTDRFADETTGTALVAELAAWRATVTAAGMPAFDTSPIAEKLRALGYAE